MNMKVRDDLLTNELWFLQWKLMIIWWRFSIRPKYTSTISCLIILSQKLETLVESGLGSSSKSGTEQFVLSKNELKLMHTVGSFCRIVSNSKSVNGGKQSKYSGLRDFLVNVPISRRWYSKVAIFSDWVKASYFGTLSVYRKYLFRVKLFL